MGIVWSLVFFVVVPCAYVYSSYQLITMNDTLGTKKNEVSFAFDDG